MNNIRNYKDLIINQITEEEFKCGQNYYVLLGIIFCAINGHSTFIINKLDHDYKELKKDFIYFYDDCKNNYSLVNLNNI